MMTLGLSVLLCLQVAVAGYEFCYDLDCYSLDPPYGGTNERPFSVVPYPCPTFYSLLTRKNPNNTEEIYNSDHKVFNSSYFDAAAKTCIIIHGIFQSSQALWIKQMCQAIMEVEPTNCIIMDWSSCSWDLYVRQIQAARALGVNIAKVIGSLEEQYAYNVENICLIGSDIGAHIAGYAGKAKKNIGRIVGLNPIEILFKGDDRIHLAKTDAKFVQVLHTDAKPFSDFGTGFVEPLGHIDIYLNGGKDMPDCPKSNITVKEMKCMAVSFLGPLSCGDIGFPTPDECAKLLKDKVLTVKDVEVIQYDFYCNHYQSINYYTDSVKNPDKYRGSTCDCVEHCMEGNPAQPKNSLRDQFQKHEPTTTSWGNSLQPKNTLRDYFQKTVATSTSLVQIESLREGPSHVPRMKGVL